MQQYQYQPLGNRVLIKRIPAEVETVGGLVLPDRAKVQRDYGEIVAIGPDAAGICYLSVGSIAYFGKYAGDMVAADPAFGLDPGEYITLDVRDVLAVLIPVPTSN